MAREIISICLVLSIHAASSISIATQSTATSVSSTSISSPSNTHNQSVLPITSSQTSLSGSSSQSVLPISLSVSGLPSTSSQPGLSTSSNFLSPKPPSSYQVTENVIDIPDDRTIPPIIPNFSISKPINIANSNVSVNKIIKNDTGDEHNQIKRTSFTYVHINKETNTEGGIKKLFKGIKDYVYNLKRGVVDGLHNYFHKHDKKYIQEEDNNKKDKEDGWSVKLHRSHDDAEKNEDDFHHQFYSSYHDDENVDEYEHDVFKHEFESY